MTQISSELITTDKSSLPKEFKIGSDFVKSGESYKSEIDFESDKSKREFQAKISKHFSPELSVGLRPKNFKAKAIFFDMDATAIGQETIVELASVCGKRSEVEEITELAMAGKLDFEMALRERVKILGGESESIISLTKPRLIIEPGLKEFIKLARSHDAKCFLISGGFVEFAKDIAESVGITDFHANQLEVKEGKLTGEILGKIVDSNAKAEWVLKMCERLGVSSKEAVAVGDGANDLEMMKVAGLSVGYAPKPVLYSEIDALNSTGSHAFLADFLFG